jgi:HEAT repeat protein
VKTDSNLYVREAAARALGQIGGDAVPALIQLLKTHPDELARGEAAKALGEMGKDGRAAAPALLEALREPAYLVRLITARAVGKVYVADKQLREAFEALAQSATRDPRREVRISAVRTLATIGPEAVPTLIQVLKKESEWIARADAAEGLAAYGHAAGETVPALVAALRDPQVPVRIRAVEALGRIGGGDEETVKALEGMSEDDDEYVRKTAREVLRKIQAGKPWG